MKTTGSHFLNPSAEPGRSSYFDAGVQVHVGAVDVAMVLDLNRHLIEDPDLRRRLGEDAKALHRTRLDLDACAERLIATWTEPVHAGER
jgi:hypothetical protein